MTAAAQGGLVNHATTVRMPAGHHAPLVAPDKADECIGPYVIGAIEGITDGLPGDAFVAVKSFWTLECGESVNAVAAQSALGQHKGHPDRLVVTLGTSVWDLRTLTAQKWRQGLNELHRALDVQVGVDTVTRAVCKAFVLRGSAEEREYKLLSTKGPAGAYDLELVMNNNVLIGRIFVGNQHVATSTYPMLCDELLSFYDVFLHAVQSADDAAAAELMELP